LISGKILIPLEIKLHTVPQGRCMVKIFGEAVAYESPNYWGWGEQQRLEDYWAGPKELGAPCSPPPRSTGPVHHLKALYMNNTYLLEKVWYVNLLRCISYRGKRM